MEPIQNQYTTQTVMALLRQYEQDKDEGIFPILADALGDAGIEMTMDQYRALTEPVKAINLSNNFDEQTLISDIHLDVVIPQFIARPVCRFRVDPQQPPRVYIVQILTLQNLSDHSINFEVVIGGEYPRSGPPRPVVSTGIVPAKPSHAGSMFLGSGGSGSQPWMCVILEDGTVILLPDHELVLSCQGTTVKEQRGFVQFAVTRTEINWDRTQDYRPRH